LTLKWRRLYYIQTHIGPVAEDLNGDGIFEIVVTGIRRSDGKGVVAAINGANGATLWEFEDDRVGTHHPCDIVDLNNDGLKEVVVSADNILVLHGNNGALYWKNTNAYAFQNYNAIFDINGDGYMEIFINSGNGPGAGYDYITCLDYQGNIKYRAWCWHPCWGGLTIGDANFDGRFEIYQGDRRVTYNPATNKYKGGAMGVRALDADTLTPLWNDPTILCSSHCPILADVDKDGILDVIVADQSNSGIAVLNSADGSVVTTGGIYRKGSTGMRAHSQPTVYDIDGDGNLELMDCREYSPVKIWDLYKWKLDATLPLNCYEPPKLGDVTGDGKLDIIAVNDTAIYIYTYNNDSKKYEQVDYVSGLNWGCNAFTLVQDVDGDGYNELIVTSMGGAIYCFDTPAPTPTPRPRSGLQFYSEYRWGAAVYVPPPTPNKPVIKDEKPLDGSLNQPFNPTLSIHATSFQGHKMNIEFKTNASGVWETIDTYVNVGNGVYSVNTNNMDRPGTTYFWSVNCTDVETGNWTSKIYKFTTYSNPPTQENPTLVLGGTGNLICSNQSTTDPEGDKVTNIYNWFVNDVSLTNLNLPFDTKVTSNPLATETLLYEGFENGLNNWKTVDWNLVSDEKHSGSYSIRAGSTSTYLLSPSIDTSNAEYITISFWYRDHGVDKWDANLQFWNGFSYVTILDLGDTKPEDTWHYYSIQTYQRNYLIPDFHIRFDGVEIDSGEYLWIDDLTITTTPRAKDYSSYENHATIHGATWTSNGVSGGAYIFDGSNDYMRIQDDPSLGGDGTWSEITIEFWIKPFTNHYGAIVMAKKEPQLSVGSYIIGFESDSSLYSANTLFFGINSTFDNKWHKTSSSSTVLQVGEWHHVVCVYKSGSGLSIYINGTKQLSMPLTGNIASNPGISVNGAPLFIGYDGGSDYQNPRMRWLNAILDEVRIYPKALSQSQILQRFIETRNGSSNSSSIVSEETEEGETWKCQVTPNDGFRDGESKFSNTLVVGPLSIQHTLFISVSGEGTTDPEPNITHLFNEGTNVTLTAIPSLGWRFSRWLINESIAIEDNPYNLTINNDYIVIAMFAQNNYTLTIETIGEGIVTKSPDKDYYTYGETVTLTANANPGWVFSGWGGNLSDSENPTTITMTGNMTVIAYFTQWWNSDWQYRRTITIDHTKVSGTLTNFPVLIEILNEGLTEKTQPDGDDFVFIDQDNNKLSHEIEFYDSVTGRLIVWVNVPYLSNTTDTVLYMYYGNPNCEDQQNPQAVWDTNYKLVLHLDEKSGIHFDSTINGNNGTPINGVLQGIDAKIDGGDTFDGVNDYIEISHSDTLAGYTKALTVSFWIKLEDTSRRQTIINKYNTINYQKGWFIEYNPENRPTRPFGFYASYDGVNYREWHASFIPLAGEWYHITVVWETNNIPKFYVNGVQVPTIGTAMIQSIYNNVGVPLHIARSTYAGRYFKGSLDEITISNLTRSLSWILTSYNNQKDPTTFYALGVEEVLLGKPIISDPYPPNGAVNVPITLNELSFNITDCQNDLMNVTVTIIPHMEPVSLTNVPSGRQFIPIGNLTYATAYTWTVEVTDGTYTSIKTFTFTTEQGPTTILTILTVGNGTVIKNPDNETYAYGTLVQLTATADVGYKFSHWEDDLTGDLNPATILMTENKSVTAIFVLNEYFLTINIEGSGSVHINCSGPYYYGSVVQLTAEADPNWIFSKWSGDITGNVNPITFTITKNMSITAYFTQWWNQDWRYCRTILINHTKISGELTNFPLLIEIVDSNLVGKTQPDGDDFVFTDANNVKLDYQIEFYDSMTGHLIAWVKVPTLSQTTDTVLYMYYGNSTCGSQQNPTAVWDTSYKLVLHLNEQTGVHYDSTINANNGTPRNGVQQGITAKIDGGDYFDGIDDYIEIPHSGTLAGYTEALTVSFWVKFEDTSRRQTILGKYNSATNQRGWFVDYNPRDRPTRPLGFYASWDGANYREWYAANFVPTADVWYHITIVWEANAIPRFYINGSQVSTVGTSTIPQIYNNVGVPLLIGRCQYDNSRYFKGYLDEITISNPARSANWILTTYSNQLSPSAFYSISPEEQFEEA
jgi:hypothetical protein